MNTDQRMPDHHAGAEPWDELSGREQASLERRIHAKAALLMGDPEFWQAALASKNPVSDAVEWQLPRMIALVDAACKQPVPLALNTDPQWHYAREGILAALHQVQKQALARALEQAREWAEENEDA